MRRSTVEIRFRRLGDHVRVNGAHQAVKRGLHEHGLARNVPVILGANEVAPYFLAVYSPTKLRDYRVAGAGLGRAGQRAHRAAYARHTEGQIAQCREHRQAIRS